MLRDERTRAMTSERVPPRTLAYRPSILLMLRNYYPLQKEAERMTELEEVV